MNIAELTVKEYKDNPVKMYKDAIAMQDASNLKGVAHTFMCMCQAVDNPRERNVAILIAYNQISHLLGYPNDDIMLDAYRECEEKSVLK